MNRSVIHLGYREIEKAIECKRQLEAFCFTVLVKAQFTSSAYHKPNPKEVSKVLQISLKKSKQILSDCLTFGYARKEGETYIFNPISEKGLLTFKLDLAKLAKKRLNNGFNSKSDTKSHLMSLEFVKNEIRAIWLIIKIQQRSFIKDTVTGFASEKSLQKAKVMQKNIERYAMNTKCVGEGSFSIYSAMNSINIRNRNKTISIFNYLIQQGYITKKRNITKVGTCKDNTFYNDEIAGCFFSYNNNLYKVDTNSYSISESVENRLQLK